MLNVVIWCWSIYYNCIFIERYPDVMISLRRAAYQSLWLLEEMLETQRFLEGK